jgi:hypothetical protein
MMKRFNESSGWWLGFPPLKFSAAVEKIKKPSDA